VAPPFNDDARPGSNLYTSSMVVLQARTGKLLWYRQQVPHDVRNWDVTHVSPIYDARVRGVPRRLVAVTGKSGLLDVYDRSTRRLVFSTPVTRRSGLDSTGAPNAGRVCPGPFGGVVYNGPAYSPRTNTIYVPAVDWCASVTKSPSAPVVPRRFNWGGTFEFDPVGNARGWLTAVDGATGQVKWRYLSSRPMIGAVAVTSTHVLFAGEIGGDLVALDARDGRPLARQSLGGPLGGGLVTYTTSGRQYVAAVSGTIGEFWGVPPAPSRVTILSLGGR
jgi:alcohol dehydrogenase (cytochrome c)